MVPKRPTRECCNILLAALRTEHVLGRKDVVRSGSLSDGEFTRALKRLLQERMITRSPDTVGGRNIDARYVLTEKALAPPATFEPAPGDAPAEDSFEDLLGAWQIRRPAVPAELPACVSLRKSHEQGHRTTRVRANQSVVDAIVAAGIDFDAEERGRHGAGKMRPAQEP